MYVCMCSFNIVFTEHLMDLIRYVQRRPLSAECVRCGSKVTSLPSADNGEFLSRVSQLEDKNSRLMMGNDVTLAGGDATFAGGDGAMVQDDVKSKTDLADLFEVGCHLITHFWHVPVLCHSVHQFTWWIKLKMYELHDTCSCISLCVIFIRGSFHK